MSSCANYELYTRRKVASRTKVAGLGSRFSLESVRTSEGGKVRVD